MGNLFLVLTGIGLLCINSSLGVVVHGSTYRIRNSADGKYITAFPHSYLPTSGLVSGKVYEEEWRDQTSQLWDAIVIRPGSESLGIFQLARTQGQMSLSKNFVNLRPIAGDRNAYLIRSVLLDKCFEGQGQHAAAFVTCNASKQEQQWEFDIIYDD